jgi:thioredoxin-related protein
MKLMKRTTALWLAGGLLLLTGGARAAEWLTDVPAALTKARAEKKLVLIDFTGSDWCGWCMKFKKETLATPEFEQFAAKNLVLVELDYPRKKPQSDDLKQANRQLFARYKPDGFPTLVVLSGDGRELGRQAGYLPGGAPAFIQEIEGWKKP